MSQRNLYDDTVNIGAFLAAGQFVSTAVASGAIPAASVAGAQENYFTQSGATALTLPTAVSIVQQLQAVLQAQGLGPFYNIPIGFTFYVRVINTNGGTLTLSAGTGVTITGTATLATATTRDFLVTITGLNTVTFQSIGTGTTS